MSMVTPKNEIKKIVFGSDRIMVIVIPPRINKDLYRVIRSDMKDKEMVVMIVKNL